MKRTAGSGNAGTCEKLHDRSRIRLRQKAGVCASALTLLSVAKTSPLPTCLRSTHGDKEEDTEIRFADVLKVEPFRDSGADGELKGSSVRSNGTPGHNFNHLKASIKRLLS